MNEDQAIVKKQKDSCILPPDRVSYAQIARTPIHIEEAHHDRPNMAIRDA